MHQDIGRIRFGKSNYDKILLKNDLATHLKLQENITLTSYAFALRAVGDASEELEHLAVFHVLDHHRLVLTAAVARFLRRVSNHKVYFGLENNR